MNRKRLDNSVKEVKSIIVKKEYEQINVSFSYTKNIGNFESIKIQMGTARKLCPNEKVDKALDEEFTIVYDKVMEEVEK